MVHCAPLFPVGPKGSGGHQWRSYGVVVHGGGGGGGWGHSSRLFVMMEASMANVSELGLCFNGVVIIIKAFGGRMNVVALVAQVR